MFPYGRFSLRYAATCSRQRLFRGVGSRWAGWAIAHLIFYWPKIIEYLKLVTLWFPIYCLPTQILIASYENDFCTKYRLYDTFTDSLKKV